MNNLSHVSPYLLSLIGLLFCFTGYKITKAVICLTGFLIGAGVLGTLANHYTEGNTLITIGAAVLGGLLISGLALGVFQAGVFLLGLAAGAVTTTLFTSELLIIGLVGVAAGITTLSLQKYMLSIATATFGAVTLIYSIYLIKHDQVFSFDAEHLEALQYYLHSERLVLPATAALAVMGVYVQFRSMKRKD